MHSAALRRIFRVATVGDMLVRMPCALGQKKNCKCWIAVFDGGMMAHSKLEQHGVDIDIHNRSDLNVG